MHFKKIFRRFKSKSIIYISHFNEKKLVYFFDKKYKSVSLIVHWEGHTLNNSDMKPQKYIEVPPLVITIATLFNVCKMKS